MVDEARKVMSKNQRSTHQPRDEIAAPAVEFDDDGEVKVEYERDVYRKALEDIARWGNVKDMAIAKKALAVSPRGDGEDSDEELAK